MDIKENEQTKKSVWQRYMEIGRKKENLTETKTTKEQEKKNE